MNFKEYNGLNRPEAEYIFLLSKMRHYNEGIKKVTLFKQKNSKGKLISLINIYLIDRHEQLHNERLRLYNDDYIWFLNCISADFPNLEFEDISDKAEETYVGDLSTFEEAIKE